MHRFRGYNLSNLAFIGLLVISPFILFWRWLLMGELLFWGTLLLQFWPWHHLVKTSLLNGQWPLWNPLLGTGTPLLANLQTGVFYPPNLLYLLLPVEQALTVSTILHLLLAGLLMYSYTRQLGLLPFAAAISGLAYMFSGYLVGRTQFITMINAAAWFPLLLLLSDKIVTRRRLIHVLWLATVLAVQLLAGHAQLWYYGLWLLGLYTLFRSWQATKEQATNEHEQPSDSQSSSLLNSFPITGLPGQIYVISHDLDSRMELNTDNFNYVFRPCSFLPVSLNYVWSWLRYVTFYPQGAFGSALLTGGLWLRFTFQTGWRLGLAIALALLLAAAQLAPTLEFTRLSPRGEGAEQGFALTYSFWPWRLITLLAPDFFGSPAQGNYWGYTNYWEDHAYIGVLPFLLALVAIGYAFKQRQGPLRVAPFFAGLVPISLILALGWNTPVYLWVFESIPGFNLFQAPARLLIWYTIAMAVLAGMGAQVFEVTARSRLNWRRLLAGCVALTLTGLIGEAVLSGRALTFVTATRWLGILLILAITLLLIRPEKNASKKTYKLLERLQVGAGTGEAVWQWAAVIFVAIDLILAALPLIPMTSAAVFGEAIASAKFLKDRPGEYRFFVDDTFAYELTFAQYFRFQAFGPVEVSHWQNFKEALIPNFGVYADIASANNNDPLVVGSWQQLANQLRTADEAQQARLLSLMNVAYLINAPQEQTWPIIYTDEQIAVQQVPDVLPRAYFAPRVVPVQNEAEALAELTGPEFDSHQEVVIITGEQSAFSDSPALSSALWSINLEEFDPNWIHLQVQAPTAGFVVLTDTFYPGWEATINGHPSPIFQANLNFRAVAVEAGSHKIEFHYRPFTFTFGLWTSFVTCLIIIATIAYLAPKT